MANSFGALGEMQQKRSELFAEAEKEGQAEFFQFQREQAELNREHEMKMLEMIMKYTRNDQPAQQFVNQVPQSQPTHNFYPHGTSMGMEQYPFQDNTNVVTTQGTTLTGLNSAPPGSWYGRQ